MLKRLTRRLARFVSNADVLIAVEASAERRAFLDIARTKTPTNPMLNGFRAYSQGDEDGIIQEIFRRLGGGETFLEFGCGDGLENNTHFLALQGWSGTWVDGDAKNIRRIREALPSGRLTVLHQFITRDNVTALPAADFVSIDVDGNDLHLMRAYVEAHKPKVVCVEYNALFPPPAVVSVEYDAGHVWQGDTYHGASLQALVNAIPAYRLVACSLSGLNAFFVRNDLAAPFDAYPVEALYMPLRFYLFQTGTEPKRTYRFLANHLRSREQSRQSAEGSQSYPSPQSNAEY